MRYHQPKRQWLGKQEWRQVGKIISIMIDRNINAYCLQETWQLCDYMLTIRGYTVLHHGMNEKTQRQGRISTGVIIILILDLTRAWKRAGKLKPITSLPTSKFLGRTIMITLSFPKKSNSLDWYIPPEGERGHQNIPLFSIPSTWNWRTEGIYRWTRSIYHESTKEFRDPHGIRHQLQCCFHVKNI